MAYDNLLAFLNINAGLEATVLLGALAIYAGAFIVPVLWGLFGLRARREFVLAAILTGGVLALVGKFLPAPWGQWVAIAAFIANLTLLWVGHHLKQYNGKKQSNHN